MTDLTEVARFAYFVINIAGERVKALLIKNPGNYAYLEWPNSVHAHYLVDRQELTEVGCFTDSTMRDAPRIILIPIKVSIAKYASTFKLLSNLGVHIAQHS
ncbi:hypothetical protein V6N11_063976 [Hibiscus sabdariffa]|uniref:Uncharacterized protein n=1 Tax=Hibiscus sabdariffa TaxID=183260 RepID=A0ABR2PMM5_9ROSI